MNEEDKKICNELIKIGMTEEQIEELMLRSVKL
jgi:hypothetical protein